MRRRFSREQWSKWLDEFESSGLSVSSFCRQIQVNQNSFYLWRRKLKSESDQNGTGDLVEIEVQRSEPIRFQLPQGISVELPNQAESIRPLLEAILELGSDS